MHGAQSAFVSAAQKAPFLCMDICLTTNEWRVTAELLTSDLVRKCRSATDRPKAILWRYINISLGLSANRFLNVSTAASYCLVYKDHERYKLIGRASLCPHPYLIVPNLYAGYAWHLVLWGSRALGCRFFSHMNNLPQDSYDISHAIHYCIYCRSALYPEKTEMWWNLELCIEYV